jgi:hypothetical protein
VVARPEGAKEILYLFTALEEPSEQVVMLYKQRWNIETDLRSLNEQVRLHTTRLVPPIWWPANC